MTLIGLAYNQKPEPTELASPLSEGGRQEDGELPRPDEEPPSRILGLTIAGLNFSISAAIGFISLFGVAVTLSRVVRARVR